MPYKEKEIEKVYWTIGEVAEILGESTSLIRFWESEFNIVAPRKKANGKRLFRKEDVDTLKAIHKLVKQQGYTLNGAKEKLKNRKKKLVEKESLLNELKELKGFLIQIKSSLEG